MNNTSFVVDQPVDPVAKTKELCSLFSTTVTSLAADAAALRQLQSLQVMVEEENGHPDNAEFTDGLRHVDSLVADLEQKVGTLQEIMAAEKRSLRDIKDAKEAAEAQHEILMEMLAARDHAIRLGRESDATTTAAAAALETPSRVDATETPDRHATETPTGRHAAGTPSRAHVGTPSIARTPRERNSTSSSVLHSGAKRVVRSRRDSVDPRPTSSAPLEIQFARSVVVDPQQPKTSSSSKIHFACVTESEWNGVSRNIRGRITRAVVNDALQDIERVFQKKYAVLSSKTNKRSEVHQKLINSHRDLKVEEHGNDPWISEQDLRQCCAFFRNGESTARAILLILRTVKRLRQVPGKHSQVTYVCPRQHE